MADDEHSIGSGPVEEEFRLRMRAVAQGIDEFLNGAKPPEGERKREVGFILMMFPFWEPPKGGRMNYMSNAKREDVVIALREQLAYFEGMPDKSDGRPGMMTDQRTADDLISEAYDWLEWLKDENVQGHSILVQLIDRLESTPQPPCAGCAALKLELDHYQHIAQREIAAGRTVPPPGAWQPIETAPKTGRTILLAYSSFVSEGHCRMDGVYVPNVIGETITPFTHWMPMPTPPTKPACPHGFIGKHECMIVDCPNYQSPASGEGESHG